MAETIESVQQFGPVCIPVVRLVLQAAGYDSIPLDKQAPDKFSPKKWVRIRKTGDLPELKFHDLRKTFASLLAQRGVSTAVTQRLLEHSSPQLTNEVYTNVDPVLRQAIGLLPVAEWV
ncbi:MAG: hypothetical protein A2Y77_02275 [Planctomycetes bacterium RBG_13_62_9]|nr:MAG: hypothetical protein A2Y77_02275 [Planctomycetes bacterium RBG_13_62_9]